MNGLLEQPPTGATPQTAAPGLINQGMATTPPTGPTVKKESTAPNQEEIDIFVANGLKIVHNPKVSDALIARIVKAKNPVVAISEATLFIVEKLEQSSAAAGKKPSLTTLAYGANALMGEIIASAEAAGMKKMDDETKYRAFSMAVGQYLDAAVKTGKMTKEEVIQLGKDAGETPEGQKIKEAMGTPGEQMETPGMGGQNGGIT